MPRKQAPYYKNRLLLPAKLSYIKKWINKMLDKGFIRELTLLAAVLLLLAAKPGGSIRIYYNYRGLNIVTIKNQYLLPLIREILNALYGAKYFTKLNIITTFNQIRITEGFKWLIVFITQFRLYKILVILFSLYNAPAIFQNYINHILHNALNNYYTAYLNNILIFSKTRTKHTKYINKVIQRLSNAGLQIDINKSKFYTTKTKYLSLIILTNSMTIDPKKVQALQEWKDPTLIKELQQFLGFANFY